MPKTISKNKPNPHQDTILVVGMIFPTVAKSILEINKKHKLKYRYLLLAEREPKNKKEKETIALFDEFISTKGDSDKSIAEALLPYKDRLLAATCRSEASIPFFQKVIPHIPYLRTPTNSSLAWSIDKLQMRRRFRLYDKKISPTFLLVHDTRKITLKEITKKIGFPLVIKPAGLAQSLLVSICYHQEELDKNLKRTFRKVNQIYRETNGRGEPAVLVEQFIEGDMYSIDAYVNSRGKVYFCPMVSVITGKQVGFDDFFAYRTMTPTNLNKQSINDAEIVGTAAIHALGLRSTTAHIELLKTEKGWKVIEVGPRIGGFRQKMYDLSFGIDHALNDILIRIPKTPKLAKRIKGHTATFKFFAKTEGKITTLTGIKKAQQLKSFNSIAIHKKISDRAIFAKHGGKSIFDITLFNKDRSKLLADIRRLEQTIKIVTGK